MSTVSGKNVGLTLVLIVISFKDVQLANASLEMLVTESGIVTDFSEEHPLKQFADILEIDDGIVIS